MRSVVDPPDGLRHVTVVEEAHRLLRRVDGRGATSQSVELFANLLAEIRSYGEGIVVAEQIPSKVIPDLIKNTALKVVHRLPAADDRDAVGGTMNLSEAQSEYVVTLPPGRAAVFVDGMDRPVLGAITYSEERERGTPSLTPPVGESRRSSTCGPECRRRACTLEDMRLAEDLADVEPGLRLWVEVAFVSHIVGEPVAGPSAEWVQRLSSVPARRIQCAVSQLVVAGTETRYGDLRLFYPPEELGRHVYDIVMGCVLGRPGCRGGEVQWRAGTRRWYDVRLALSAKDGDHTKRHPQTDAWADRGLRLPEAAWKEQLAAVDAHPSNWFVHQRRLELGADTSAGLPGSAIGRAVSALTGRPAAIGQALAQVGLEVSKPFLRRLIKYAEVPR